MVFKHVSKTAIYTRNFLSADYCLLEGQ